MMHHVLERETDLRDRLGRLAGLDLDEAREIVEEVRKRTEVSIDEDVPGGWWYSR
jgi:VIT1/CCC1 family predicted Fe2+/Mn2+ transporter